MGPWQSSRRGGWGRRYDGKPAVTDLSFEVQPGSVTGFLGPNGAGKSTTMRLMLGLDRRCGHDDVRRRAVHRPPPARCGTSARCSRRSRSTPPARPATTCACWPRRNGIPRAPGRRGARAARALRRRPQEAEDVLARHGSAARPRRRAARRPAHADPRRAGQRPRPAGHPVDPRAAQGLRGTGRSVFVSSHLLVRDGADGRPARRHRPRQADRQRADRRLHQDLAAQRRGHVRTPQAAELAELLRAQGGNASRSSSPAGCRSSASTPEPSATWRSSSGIRLHELATAVGDPGGGVP